MISIRSTTLPTAVRRVSICLYIAGLVSIAACRKQTPEIAVIPRTCGTWLWEAEHTGVEREAPEQGLYVYWNAPMREDDVQRQIEILAGAVKRRVRGVIIAPIEDLPLRSPLHRALHAEIPVVVVGTDLGLTPDRHLAYVLNDERAGGELAARRVGQLLRGHGSVAILGINKRLTSTAERARSFETTLATEFPEIHVAFRSLALPTVSQEQQVTERMLAEGTRPDAIVALSEPSTRGTFFALIEFNRTRKIRLIGFDQNVLAPIRTGEIDAVIIQNTYEMGRAATRLISDELVGRDVQSRVIVQPELVTRETIDSPRVRETLDLDWFRK
jgi:ribose transport system substrate-binding protein